MYTIKLNEAGLEQILKKINTSIYNFEVKQKTMTITGLKSKEAVFNFYINELQLILDDLQKQKNEHDQFVKDCLAEVLEETYDEEEHSIKLRRHVLKRMKIRSYIDLIVDYINGVENYIELIKQELNIEKKLGIQSTNSCIKIQQAMLIYSKNQMGCSGPFNQDVEKQCKYLIREHGKKEGLRKRLQLFFT